MSQSNQCVECKHFMSLLDDDEVKSDRLERTAQSCQAYPEGIPLRIITGQHDHRKAFEDDQGIRFERLS